MAKENKTKKPGEVDESQQDTEKLYKITHNLNAGQIIVLRRNTQNYLNHLPQEEQVSLSMVNKKGDDALYFRATQIRATRIADRLDKQARDWSYVGVNLKMQVVEEEPDNLMDAEDLERLEEKIGESYKEELGRLHMQIGGLTTEITHAKEDLHSANEQIEAAEDLNTQTSRKLAEYRELVESLNSLKENLVKGTLADACIRFINARGENVEMLELLLADIKDSGLDVDFITKPPESLERYAKEKLLRTIRIELDFHDLERSIEIGEAETWEESRLYMPKEEIDEATEKLDKLTQIIANADESIKGILEENLRVIIGEFNAAVKEYTSKQRNYNQSRLANIAYKKAIEEGTDNLARAKELKVSLADLRKMKFPVYAIPEQDGATIHFPAYVGIAYDSFIEAVNQHAQVKSEEEISGNTVLRIGGTNGSWNPVRIFRAIKESYESGTEAGKIGSKLGLLVQF